MTMKKVGLDCSMGKLDASTETLPAPLDVPLVARSFARCLVERECTPEELIGAANLLLDEAIGLLQSR